MEPLPITSWLSLAPEDHAVAPQESPRRSTHRLGRLPSACYDSDNLTFAALAHLDTAAAYRLGSTSQLIRITDLALLASRAAQSVHTGKRAARALSCVDLITPIHFQVDCAAGGRTSDSFHLTHASIAESLIQLSDSIEAQGSLSDAACAIRGEGVAGGVEASWTRHCPFELPQMPSILAFLQGLAQILPAPANWISVEIRIVQDRAELARLRICPCGDGERGGWQ
jgi:hypothetical protein